MLAFSRSRFRLSRYHWWGLVFITPWQVGFVVFQAGPMVGSFLLSFTRCDLERALHCREKAAECIRQAERTVDEALRNAREFELELLD
jgi:ABC-type sugar transport system permease subunit